jgi:hypothetical protein
MPAKNIEDEKLTQFATTILKGIAEKTINPETLSIDQRRLCVQYMLHEKKWTQLEISEIMHTCRKTVQNDKEAILETNMVMLLRLDNRKWALELIHTAAMASARLFRKGREREAWQVEKECVEMMQTLGFVGKEPEKMEGTLKLLEMLKYERDSYIRGNEGEGNDNQRFFYERGSLADSPEKTPN